LRPDTYHTCSWVPHAFSSDGGRLFSCKTVDKKHAAPTQESLIRVQGRQCAGSRVQALVRERMEDWGRGLCRALGKKIVELTGDFTPDVR
jgi:hypothetical protein